MIAEGGPRKDKYLVTKRRRGAVYNQRVKVETLTYYGPAKQLKCSWLECEVIDLDMLTLDHINNDGNIERKAWCSQGGVTTYSRLRKNGFPSGYQTLCANHQMKKDLVRRRALAQANN